MRSTFFGLEIARSGLMVSRNELDVTGHNVSNVDTVGYSRQRLYTKAIPAPGYNAFIKPNIAGTTGVGVRAITVQQIRNPFLDAQYRQQNASAADWATREQYFSYVESLFNDELDDIDAKTGLSALFSSFYSSLDKLAQGATPDLEIRTNVKVSAQNLIDNLHYYSGRLLEQQATLNQTISVSVDQINDYAKQIASLNEQIFSYELSGAIANDLRDSRNLLMDELSSLANIEYSEDGNGYYSVRLDGHLLVRHTDYNMLTVDATMENAAGADLNKMYEVYWANSDGSPGRKVNITGGAVAGYMHIRDGNGNEDYGIPHIMNQLNNLARTIVRDVNAIHSQGWTMPYVKADGTQEASQQGINFFEQPAGANTGDVNDPLWLNITAANIKLDDKILENVYNIAASSEEIVNGADNEHRGNNEIANQLCQLLTKKDAAGNPVNFDSIYTEIVTGIASAQDHFKNNASSLLVVTTQIDEQRQSISAVSLDEEMTDMIRFGHAYNAASRMITTIDETLDTLINKMGVVGR